MSLLFAACGAVEWWLLTADEENEVAVRWSRRLHPFFSVFGAKAVFIFCAAMALACFVAAGLSFVL